MVRLFVFALGASAIVWLSWLAAKVRRLDLSDEHTHEYVKYRANRYLLFESNPESTAYFGRRLIHHYRLAYYCAILGFFAILYALGG